MVTKKHDATVVSVARSKPRPEVTEIVVSEDMQIVYMETVEERVVGGEIARPNSWPWQISLQYKSGSNYYHTCGGSLIRKQWVMTAAHCVDSRRTWRVVLGDHNISAHEGKEQYTRVSHVYIHPNWNSNRISSGYDIALLRLSNEAVLNSNVQLALLPPSGQVLPHNNPCYITGWGRTSSDWGQLSSQLKQAYLPVVDHKTCSSGSWWGGSVKTTMVCAGARSLFVFQLSNNIPVLRHYLDESFDLRADLRLSRQSATALCVALTLNSDHGWQKDIEVLVFLYWLAHAASFMVVSRAFDIPKSSVHLTVHKAICDHRGRFIDIFVGYPGSVHDARVLKTVQCI
ncbi:elastase-1-like [Chanos chanos]|uniref:pancreatic elastase n=1 Tax=Chanos chanos TaxID=29144 RepID=A0A6J2VSF4_CHACN|nr:elastase-1-like [Chanos chanos]